MKKAGILILASVVLPTLAYAATININTATAAQLDTLSGIGPTKAAAIVDYRTKNGPFATIEDIQKVSGIGPVTFANIKDSITVGATSAAPTPAPVAPQPSPAPTSYKQVQQVEPITSQKAVETNEDAVAPATTNENVGAGAMSDLEVVTSSPRAPSLFSVWTLGLLGVIVASAGAFIFL